MERLTVIILSIVIACLLIGVGTFLFFRVRSDVLALTTRESGIVPIHFMFHEEEELREGVLMLYGVQKGRLALLSVPGNVGMLLRNLERIDSIDTLFDSKAPQDYLLAVEELAEISIPFYISISYPGDLVRLVDLLGGIRREEDERKDGLQIVEEIQIGEITYSDLVKSFFLTFQEDIPFFTHSSVRKRLLDLLDTNLDKNSFTTLVGYTKTLDGNQVFQRTVEGNTRNVIANEESKSLLFPFFDGQWTREYINEMQQVLVAEEAVDTNAVSVRILNGTDVVGLARQTANLLQGFGFIIVEIGNTDNNDYAHTVVVNHTRSTESGERIAQVIQANAILNEASIEDFEVTLILGRDFDGRYVRDTD